MAGKIAEALGICEQVRDASGGRAIVAFSGGKDSQVVLDLCVRVFGAKNVDAFFMYFVRGLEVVEAPIRQAMARYPGVRLLPVPHWELSRYLKLGIFCHPHARGLKILKVADIERLVRARTGADWIGAGWRKADSITRRVVLKTDGLVWPKHRKFFPIGEWLDREVYSYMRSRGIPTPPRFGADAKTSGVSGMNLSVETLRYLRDQHPADYRKVLDAFPLAGAQLARAAMFPELFQKKG